MHCSSVIAPLDSVTCPSGQETHSFPPILSLYVLSGQGAQRGMFSLTVCPSVNLVSRAVT